MKVGQFSQLVLTKVQLNLKSEAKKSYLSYMWWILEPALFVGVFYLVFGVFLARGTEDFLIFLLCGQIPFLWFARSILNSASAIENGRGLMQQIKIPKIFFPSVTILQDFFKMLCVFILFGIFLVVYGIEVTKSWFYLPLLIVVQFCFISCLAVFISMIVPFLPDFKYLVNTAMQLTMFASGIFYDYKMVILEQHHNLFLLNPIANLITQYREVIQFGGEPDFYALAIIGLGSLTFLFICSLILKKIDSVYPRVLVQ